MKPSVKLLGAVAIVVAACGLFVLGACLRAKQSAAPQLSAGSPVLAVTTTVPRGEILPIALTAEGDVAAWQELVISTETSGLRLADVRVSVGDAVSRGQVLAVFAPETVQAALEQSRAAVLEAEANLADASANAQRARDLSVSGALSQQQINQFLTSERTADARVKALRAAAAAQELRLRQTQLVAPDAGIISSRTAGIGTVMPTGGEMFRLIRQGRLEWRAEVAAADLARVKPGMPAEVTAPDGKALKGTVRMVAPTVNERTRTGIVFVDLASSGDAKAGMFLRGTFGLGSSRALTVPQSAVVIRDGFSYLMTVSREFKVTETKVVLGRRVGAVVEVAHGLQPDARVVVRGAGLVAHGDLVKTVADDGEGRRALGASEQTQDIARR